MPDRKLLIIVIGALSIGVGIWLGSLFVPSGGESPKPQISGIYLAPPKPVEGFKLTNQSGQTFTEADLKENWSLLFFGYTFCPDVCPATLAQLNQVHSQLAKQGLDKELAVWMISVDPERDNAERLKEYTAFFNPAFGGATGERQEIDKLAKQFGVYYRIHEPEPGADFYLVDHSATIIVINPAGQLQAVLTETSSADNLVNDFLAIKSQYDNAHS